MSATGTAHRRASMPRQPLAMPGYLPSIGFDGTLLDGHAVADLAAAGGPLAQRTPSRNDHRSDGETCCRRMPSATAVHVTVDGFVRDPRHRNAAAAATGRSAVATNRVKFGGDQARQLHIRGQPAHFRTLRPPVRSRIGSQRRYAARPPLVTISRDTVDDGRPIRAAIDRAVTPAAIPREISSRSTKVR